MSVIYSFLQKRKLHENQYGFLMVFTAYILSALMLALGSDVFYNINSSAADINSETKEETQDIINIDLPGMSSANTSIQLSRTELINPYGIIDTAEAENTEAASAESGKTDGDTVWLLGNAMDQESFDNLMVQVGGLEAVSNAVQKTENTEKDSAAAKENTAKETISTEYSNITNKEVKMLERIVEAEASGEDMVGKILIVNVILNRVEDDSFPDTIEDVIFQEDDGEYQFSPIEDSRYWSVKVSSSTKKAVQRALQGEDYSKGALYFIAKKRANSDNAEWFDNHLKWLFKHGGHEFYKNR